MTKILVIEDEFDIRDEVISWLQFEGYDVVEADNGKTGLDAIYNETPDLVLCDVSMPLMDGHEVLIEIRSDVNYAQLPFIFLTAAADRDAMRKGMTLGADDYLTKPFTHAEVITAVKTRLGKQAQVRQQIDQLSTIISNEREQRLLKSRLIGMFSHDFRNPLASILSSSNILQSYSDRLTPERQQKHFHRIDGAVHLLLQMLDEMLLVAQIENEQLTFHPQPTNLKHLIDGIISDFRLIDEDRHPIHFSGSLPDTAVLDPKLTRHIITNLVSNAIKYSPAGCTVQIQAQTAGEQIIIAVQDGGIGIAEADQQHVFEPFFRAANARHAKGTGLGLALVQQALELCGGQIEVTSEINQGTVFEVRLPISQ